MNPSAHTESQRILLVDDDESVLSAMETAFLESGRDVIAIGTYEQAREMLRSDTFDVLLTDVRLGAFNGLQLAVIAREANPDVQLIVFSGFDDPVLRADAEHLGATYLVKPVTSAHIMSLIRS
jgi:DNA-binding NtrC family response regulator